MVAISEGQGRVTGGPVPEPSRSELKREVAAPPLAAAPVQPKLAADALEGVGDALSTLMGVLQGESSEPLDATKLAEALKQLDPVLPSLTQAIVELLMRSSTLVEQLLGLVKPEPLPRDRFVVIEPVPPQRGSYEPLPPLGAVPPPLAPVGFSAEKLASLATPELPGPWLGWLQGAIDAPWVEAEGELYTHEVPGSYTLVELREAVEHLPDLEAFFGGTFYLSAGALRATDHGRSYFQTFLELAQRLGPPGVPGITGQYLVALYQLYRDYKAEYHGLHWAWRRLLDRQDPAHPLAQTERDLDRYLEQKYGPRLRGLLRRAIRTPILTHDYVPREPLGVDGLFQLEYVPADRAIAGSGFRHQRQGNYLAVRSAGGDLEVQLAVGPHPDGRGAMVPLGVAIQVGSDRLIYDAQTKRLWVNGLPSAWGDGHYALPGGGRVRFTPGGMLVTSPRHDGINVLDQGGYLDVFGHIHASRLKGSVNGLLGFFDGNDLAYDDLTTRDGVVLQASEVERREDAWRLRPGESLFDGATAGPWQPG